jgi:isopentenyldiphosphate isomerase
VAEQSVKKVQSMDEPEEHLWLVDRDDKPVGSIRRQGVLSLEENGRGYTRAVGVFLTNSEGELWVPRRGRHKKVAGGGLDFSTGEHVGYSESYDAAALRGMREELSMSPDPHKLLRIGRVPPFPGMPYFHEIYVYQSDAVPEYNKEDYDSYEWLNPQTVGDRLSGGEAAKEILAPSIQLVLRHTKNERSSI